MKSISRRERGLALFFLLALAWGAWNYRGLFKSSPSPGPDALAGSSESVPVQAEGARASKATAGPGPGSSQFSRPDWGTDPFNRSWRQPGATVAVITQGVRKAALHLTAIVVRPSQRYAVINGAIVREGQEVAGRRITRIEASRVLVDDNGVEVTLTL